jgi:hypothetical protein
MKQPELKKVTVNKLRQDLLARRFAIPKLQRNFVWDSGRAAKLLDSMYCWRRPKVDPLSAVMPV